MEIESFADSGNDIGSDVQEVQDSDMDFGTVMASMSLMKTTMK